MGRGGVGGREVEGRRRTELIHRRGGGVRAMRGRVVGGLYVISSSGYMGG